jgi:hypothetical protein
MGGRRRRYYLNLRERIEETAADAHMTEKAEAFRSWMRNIETGYLPIGNANGANDCCLEH